jgi:hypothetical protein
MISDKELCALWHGLEPSSKLAPALGMTPKQLLTQWRRLRALGLLPDRARTCGKHQPVTEPNQTDGRPRTSALGKGEDPLGAILDKGVR